jgi:hypothetical protein
MTAWKLFACFIPLALLSLGCPAEEEYREFGEGDDVTNVAPPDEHAHVHGPHDGHVIELGDEEYHAEVVLGSDRKLVVYILGPDAATSAPIMAAAITVNLEAGETPTALTLNAVPQEGEADGQSSRFELTDGTVPESVTNIEEVHGDLVIAVGDKTYTAEIGHDHGHDHGDHDHDHGHEH